MRTVKTVNEVLRHKGGGEVFSIAPDASVFEAVRLMAERHVGALPVLDDGQLAGIISERDYARKVILKDKSSKQIRVAEIMTPDVIKVTAHDRVASCVEKMKQHHIRHLVVEEDGVVIGVLSLRDLFSEIISEQAETIDQLEHYIHGAP